ncbi:MAG: threonine/serine exporter family protein [Microthrixaceae bacterium]
MSSPEPAPHPGYGNRAYTDYALKVMSAGLAVGEAMLRSRVATTEVESSVRRLLSAYGLQRCEVSVLLNQVELSLLDNRLEAPITLLKTTDIGEARLDLLASVETLVRSAEAGGLDLDHVYAELPAITEAAPARPRWVESGFYLVSVAAWVVFAGGGWIGAVLGIISAALIQTVVSPLARNRIPEAFGVALAAAVTVAVPSAAAYLEVPVALTPAIVGGLFPLLPGSALVASVTDWLYGAPISAMAKGLQTVLDGVSLALGAAAALAAVDALGIVSQVEPPATPTWLIVTAAAVAVTALALSHSMPVRLAPAAAAITVAAWATRDALGEGLQAFPTDVFVAAIVIGAGSQLLARIQRTNPSILTTSTVFVLVPGFLMYSSMVAFTSGMPEKGGELLIASLGIAGAIAAGIALGLALTRSVPLPRPRARTWKPAPTRASGRRGVRGV